MPVLFISHSSRDDDLVQSFERWLRSNGFTDLFVDHSNIASGDKWREELRASAGSCRVVLCIVTGSWLSSLECFNEFRAAWYMGKRIIPAFLHGDADTLTKEQAGRLREVYAEDQGVSLVPCINGSGTLEIDSNHRIANQLKMGLRAGGALSRVGLDPEAFEIDRKLKPTPFPGLASFGDDDADAALFFGRSREIAHILEELRKMRAERDQRPLVILGASGAGKSSLLKAGIIPRLRREAPAWLPLRSFRPGADPLLNLSEAFARTLADFGVREAHGLVRDALFRAWLSAERNPDKSLAEAGTKQLATALETVGDRLCQAAGRENASILVSVDQAEEVARTESDSGEALADFLRVALAAPSHRWQLAFTIRTDSFPELQKHRRFQNLEARGYDLRTIPVFRFDNVIEEPAKRYAVEVDQELIDQLMEDAPKEDALPLLGFATQRLWRQYADSGRLTKDNYLKVGGLRGLIENAAERALHGIEPEQDIPLPAGEPSKRLVTLAHATFIPALAQVNDQGATIRRVADWSTFDQERQELLSRFDRWRLVVRKSAEQAGGTIEVAHEALFREWSRLKKWLEPERERLEALRSLEVAAVTWNRHARRPAYLDHRGTRLKDTRKLLHYPKYRERVGINSLDYIKACNKAESTRTWLRRGLVAGLVVFAITATGVVESRMAAESFASEAKKENDLFLQSREVPRIRLAQRYALAGVPPPAAVLGGQNAGLACSQSDGANAICELRRAVGQYASLTQFPTVKIPNDKDPRWVSVSDNGTIALAFADRRSELGALRLIDVETSKDLARFDEPGIASGFISRDATRLVVARKPSVTLYEYPSLTKVQEYPGENLSASFDPAGTRLIVTEQGRAIRLFDTKTGAPLPVTLPTAESFLAIAGNLIVTANEDLAHIWDLTHPAAPRVLKGHTSTPTYAAISPNATLVMTIAYDGTARLWDASGKQIGEIFKHDQEPSIPVFNPGGTHLAIAQSGARTSVGIYALDTLDPISSFLGHYGRASSLVFLPNGEDVLSAAQDSTVRIWNWRTGRELANFGFKGSFYRFLAEAFLLPEDRLVTVVNGDVRLWDLAWLSADQDLVRSWACDASRAEVFDGFLAFTPSERKSNSYLRGRPANVCLWRGLASREGWRQLLNRWRYVLTGYEAYDDAVGGVSR